MTANIYCLIMQEVDVPIISNSDCENKLRRTRLGPDFNLDPGFICAGGEEGKDACKVNDCIILCSQLSQSKNNYFFNVREMVVVH